MEQFDLILDYDDATTIDQCLAAFIEQTRAQVVLLVGREGSLVAKSGEYVINELDSLCALAAGMFASSESLAIVAGETAFTAIAHQGKQFNIYVTVTGETNIIVAIYDKNVSGAVIRLHAKVTSEAIVHILERAYARVKKARIKQKSFENIDEYLN